MEKETMDRLDKMNLLWLLEKVSVGNIVRGVMSLSKVAESVKKCVITTAEKVKTVIKEEPKVEQPAEEQPKPAATV